MRKDRLLRAFISFILVMIAGPAQAGEPGAGTLSGKIQTADGQALFGVKIDLFDVTGGPTPFSNDYWRKYDYVTFTSDDGVFSLQLPEGRYYLMVVKEGPNRIGGPPTEGDLIYPPLDGRESKQYSVKAGETTDVGVINELVPFRKSWTAKGRTGIQGVVIDKKGKPVEGRLVLASSSPDVEKHVYMSDQRTDRDGRFILRVPQGGLYYLRVRGSRQPIASASVKTGAMTGGIEITLIEPETK